MTERANPRFDWTRAEIERLAAQPFADLILQAQAVLRANFPPNAVQRAQLLNIKTGGCAENCGYCSQSAHFDTGLKASRLMDVDAVIEAAAAAKAGGAERFCMGAAWRELKDRDVEAVCTMIAGVKELGLETCVTLGMLGDGQAERLKAAGLDYYNHNLDTGPDYYDHVVTTRTYQDRLDTLAKVRSAGIAVCCGGILGMGEAEADRVGLLLELSKLSPHPESVPINKLVPIPGTPMAGQDEIDGIEFARWIAVSRIVFPRSVVRLSAGRDSMSKELQALCLLAGANSMFWGGKLLTTGLPAPNADEALLDQLGIATFADAMPAE